MKLKVFKVVFLLNGHQWENEKKLQEHWQWTFSNFLFANSNTNAIIKNNIGTGWCQ